MHYCLCQGPQKNKVLYLHFLYFSILHFFKKTSFIFIALIRIKYSQSIYFIFIIDLSWNSSPEYSSQLLVRHLEFSEPTLLQIQKLNSSPFLPNKLPKPCLQPWFPVFWVSLMSYQSFQQATVKVTFKESLSFLPQTQFIRYPKDFTSYLVLEFIYFSPSALHRLDISQSPLLHSRAFVHSLDFYNLSLMLSNLFFNLQREGCFQEKNWALLFPTVCS